MANLSLFSLSLLFSIISLPLLGSAISSCNGPCDTLNDCNGTLICINGRCDDDPNVGTQICQRIASSPFPSAFDFASPPHSCKPSGTVKCGGKSYLTYKCSPHIMYSTPAKLTYKDFSQDRHGGGPSKCDKKYHHHLELIVALSTGWYNNGSLCGEKIKITASNGKHVIAKVVDECDSKNGCDKEHLGQPPCGNNIVEGSDGVWRALGMDKNVGVADITWSVA